MKIPTVLTASLLSCASAFAVGCPNITNRALIQSIGLSTDRASTLSVEVPDCSNLKLSKDHVNFVLNEDNPKVHNGVRSEVAIGFPFDEGETVVYEWSVLLPSSSPPGDESARWWLIGQWHDQPDPRLGETWATFKHQSPPLAIYVAKRDGQIGLGLAGVNGVKISWAPMPLDKWIRITARIKWSTSDGLADVTFDSDTRVVVRHAGKNMLNSYFHYFKAGQYRAPEVRSKAEVLMKHFKITRQ
jgi:Polysaccharide lyase